MSKPFELVSQAAALPMQGHQICLVRSRRGKRWLLPKGKIAAGHTPQETALLEAWQEAGVVGVLEPEALGRYRYEKRARWYEVEVFVLQVTRVAETWPEQSWRSRWWLPPAEAIEQITEKELQELISCALPQLGPTVIA